MTSVYTVLALTAFAANSLLCRLALGGRAIDAASFTTIRIMSGAAMLLAISAFRPAPAATGAAVEPPDLKVGPTYQPGERRVGPTTTPAWRSVVALFAYAIAFSFAYLSLTTGTGALILFGAVQTTIMVVALLTGERPRPLEWVGLFSAVAGIVVLVFPGLTAPPLLGSALMAIAGASWGFYTLWGRGTKDPLVATTWNFARAVPLTVVASVAAIGRFHVTGNGAVLAASSGAITSGVGYVIWYAALRSLSATRAAIVQSATPVLAAIGGVIFLSEQISLRLVVAAVMILGGIGLAVMGRSR
jgi:drug/metabolite transporter (DMT)-like permease